MNPFLFLLGIASALTPGEIEADLDALRPLRADPTRYRLVEAPIEIADGPMNVVIRSGLMVPVFAGRGAHDRPDLASDDELLEGGEGYGSLAFAGFVYVDAEATVEVGWADPRDATAFANHLVRALGADREDTRPIAAGAPWTSPSTSGMVLSTEPEILTAFLGAGAESVDPLEVVVYADKPRPGVRQQAVQVFSERSAALQSAGVHAERWLAEDRVTQRLMEEVWSPRRVLDVQIDDNLGHPLHPARQQPARHRWLTAVRDPTGEASPRDEVSVRSIYRDPLDQTESWTLTAAPFPPGDPDDPDSAPTPTHRAEILEAAANLLVGPRAADMEVEVTARLMVEAVGGPLHWFSLEIPRGGQPAAFRLNRITTLDGVDIRGPSPPRDGHGGWRTGDYPVMVVLPEPIQAGERVAIEIVWRDVWPWVNIEWDAYGFWMNEEGSGAQRFLPRTPSAGPGNPVPYVLEIGLPDRPPVRPAASGSLVRTWTEDPYFRASVEGVERPAYASVALSRFQIEDRPKSRPIVRTRALHKAATDLMITQTRHALKFLERELGRLPFDEVTIFQGPSTYPGPRTTPQGLLNTSQQLTHPDAFDWSDGLGGNHHAYVMSHELSHAWWGQSIQPAHARDEWFTEVFSEVFACLFLDEVDRRCDDRMALHRAAWEDPDEVSLPRASLTGAPESPHRASVLLAYGPVVFHDLLRARLGDAPYRRALRQLARDLSGHTVTTEQIEARLSEITRTDLSDFFGFWVHGGYVPERLDLTWSWTDGELVLRLESDPVFGTFAVPVSIDGQELWIDVVDGRGSLLLERARPLTVVLDPDRVVPTRARRVYEQP